MTALVEGDCVCCGAESQGRYSIGGCGSNAPMPLCDACGSEMWERIRASLPDCAVDEDVDSGTPGRIEEP